jgi:exopolysaccharide production protein ExoQ
MHGRLRSLADEALFFFALSLFSGAYINIPMRLTSQTLERGGSNPYNTMAMAGILCSVIVLGAAEWRRIILIARHAQLVNLFVLLAALSAVWSFDPSVTLRRVLTLSTTIGFGYYAVMRFPMVGIIRRIAVVSLVSGFASAAVAAAAPAIGVMSEGLLAGDWNGVFTHKQELGWAMFLGSLCLGWLCIHDKGWRRIAYCAGIPICLGLIVMARSQTALLSVLMLPAVGACTCIARLPGVARMWAVYALAIGVIAIATTVTLNPDGVMAVVDRDVTLTGRVPLWGLLLQIAAERPFTGYGYGGFWLEDNPTAHYIWDVIGWQAPEAHNSYIDMLLQVGVPGMLLSTAVLFGTVRGALAAVADRVPWATFAASYTIILSMTNLVETMLFHPGDVQCMLVPLLYVALRSREAGAVLALPAAAQRGGRGTGDIRLAQMTGGAAPQSLQ